MCGWKEVLFDVKTAKTNITNFIPTVAKKFFPSVYQKVIRIINRFYGIDDDSLWSYVIIITAFVLISIRRGRQTILQYFKRKFMKVRVDLC
jgi:hypothetical protein